MNSLVNCGVMSLPTNGDGYAGALYILVRFLFLAYSNPEMSNAQKMMAPSTAPTMTATGEFAWLANAGALPDGVAVADALCVTVLIDGSARLNVMSESRDGGNAVVDIDGGSVVVTVIIKTDFMGVRDGSEAMYDQLALPCIMVSKPTSSWGPVLVGRTGTTWHAWIYRAATTEAIAHVEYAPCRTVVNSSSKFWDHGEVSQSMDGDDRIRMNRYDSATTAIMKPHRHVCSKPSSTHAGGAVVSRLIYANKASDGKGTPLEHFHVKRAARCSYAVKE
jgi:hypothetical protein